MPWRTAICSSRSSIAPDVTPAALAEAHAEYDRRHARRLRGAIAATRTSLLVMAGSAWASFRPIWAAPGRLFPGPRLGEPPPSPLAFRGGTGGEGSLSPRLPERGRG